MWPMYANPSRFHHSVMCACAIWALLGWISNSVFAPLEGYSRMGWHLWGVHFLKFPFKGAKTQFGIRREWKCSNWAWMMKTGWVWLHWPHGTSQSLSSAHLLGNDKSEKARERKVEGKIQVFHPSLLWRLVIINTEQVSVHTCCLCAVCSHSQILPALPECQIDYYFSLCDRPRDFLHSAQYPSDAFWAARSDVYVKSAVMVTVEGRRE